MGVAFSAERGLLAEEEIVPVERSHYPLLEAAERADLVDLARLLRAWRDRARDIVHDRRRIRRGKGEPRGTATESASERGLSAKKQVFSRALKRVNARHAALLAGEKRARSLARMREALDRKGELAVHHPGAGPSAGPGMRPRRAGGRPRPIVQPARIGSVSQAGRVAQARRDGRR
jgi:hypothetical protein